MAGLNGDPLCIRNVGLETAIGAQVSPDLYHDERLTWDGRIPNRVRRKNGSF